VHHLDLIDHYIFQFFQTFVRKCLKLYKKYTNIFKKTASKFINFNKVAKVYNTLTLENKNYLINLKKIKR
jgi:hypothetical protein